MDRRRDGRTLTQLRSKELRTSYLSKFDGSAWYTQGQTAVVAAVNGPMAARPEQEDFSKCVVETVITRSAQIPTAGGASRAIVQTAKATRDDADSAMAALVSRCVEALVLTDQFPRCVVHVVIDILSEDGSLMAVVINAVTCALLSAGIPCRTTMAAVSVLLVPSSSSASAYSILLDPTAEEERDQHLASSTMVFALPQSGGGVIASKVDANSRGLSLQELAQLEAVSEKASRVLFEFFRNCSAPIQDADQTASL